MHLVSIDSRGTYCLPTVVFATNNVVGFFKNPSYYISGHFQASKLLAARRLALHSRPIVLYK